MSRGGYSSRFFSSCVYHGLAFFLIVVFIRVNILILMNTMASSGTHVGASSQDVDLNNIRATIALALERSSLPLTVCEDKGLSESERADIEAYGKHNWVVFPLQRTFLRVLSVREVYNFLGALPYVCDIRHHTSEIDTKIYLVVYGKQRSWVRDLVTWKHLAIVFVLLFAIVVGFSMIPSSPQQGVYMDRPYGKTNHGPTAKVWPEGGCGIVDAQKHESQQERGIEPPTQPHVIQPEKGIEPPTQPPKTDQNRE